MLSKFQISIEHFKKQDKTVAAEAVKFKKKKKKDWIERLRWVEQNL